MRDQKEIFIVCGVSGSGKSTIGRLLSVDLGYHYYEGDDYHPGCNIRKMAAGQSLDDNDRLGWLKTLNKTMQEANHCMVMSCSALKESYREILRDQLTCPIHWIFLVGGFDMIERRISSRTDHFMPSSLLQSQFDTLELPTYGQTYYVSQSPLEITKKIKSRHMKKELGLIGLGVMGKSLARNFGKNGISLSLYNRRVAGKEEDIAIDFIAQHQELSTADGYEDLGRFVDSLAAPRKIFLMISAGEAVDMMISLLSPMLSPGDIIIDGGNSHYKATETRNKKLQALSIEYIGTGVSGGEKGALEGPSIMPGGSPRSYACVKDMLEGIAAKDIDGNPCCTHIGNGGAGHFVKMVHNGIEYAEMQLIAEIVGLLSGSANMSYDKIADLFTTWNNDKLGSYLLEITIDILKKKDGNTYILDQILDKAGNKGTGSWTTIAACELGVPIPTITAALFARYQSTFKSQRVALHQLYESRIQNMDIDLDALRNAYQAARIINHHQGLDLIYQASKIYDWHINLHEVARIWTNGCIIRSALIRSLIAVLQESESIMHHRTVVQTLKAYTQDLSKICAQASLIGSAMPCLQSALSYYQMTTQAQSTANVIQAQRDYFGAHTYQRVDDPDGLPQHTQW